MPRLSLVPLLLLLALLGCDRGFADPSRELGPAVDAPDGATLGRVEIHRPPTLGVLDTPLRDVRGAPIGVACDTCHGADPDDPDAAALALALGNPEQMHQAVELRHGELSCNACHDEEDRRLLHLADGRSLEMGEAMELCAQCHGPQHRDYRHASHGGMTGAWDLRRGDRVRNHCLDCHEAHAPAWGHHEPVFPPMDRGTVGMRAATDEGSHR